MIYSFDLALIDPIANQTHIILAASRFGCWYLCPFCPRPHWSPIYYWGA